MPTPANKELPTQKSGTQKLTPEKLVSMMYRAHTTHKLSQLPLLVSTHSLPAIWMTTDLTKMRLSETQLTTPTTSWRMTNSKTICSALMLLTREEMINSSTLMPLKLTLTSSPATLERPLSQPWRKRPKYNKLLATAPTVLPNTSWRDAPTTTINSVVPWPRTNAKCRKAERSCPQHFASEVTKTRSTPNAETKPSSDVLTVAVTNSVFKLNSWTRTPSMLLQTHKPEWRKKSTLSLDKPSPRPFLNASNSLLTNPSRRLSMYE